MWKDEIDELWKRLGDISGDRGRDGREHHLNSRKGFGYGIRKTKVRPSNTSIRDLLGNGAFAEAILPFLKDTKIGMIKEGVLENDYNPNQNATRLTPFLALPGHPLAWSFSRCTRGS